MIDIAVAPGSRKTRLFEELEIGTAFISKYGSNGNFDEEWKTITQGVKVSETSAVFFDETAEKHDPEGRVKLREQSPTDEVWPISAKIVFSRSEPND